MHDDPVETVTYKDQQVAKESGDVFDRNTSRDITVRGRMGKGNGLAEDQAWTWEKTNGWKGLLLG